MGKIRFSIITVCRNSGQTIERTIKSVINQSHANYEYVVVDGQSTDNTTAIIDQYRENIARFISEKDEGLYDAMNKGIALARGEFVVFLNADDYFFDGKVLERIEEVIRSAPPAIDVYYGHVLVFDDASCKGDVSRTAIVNRFSLYRGPIPHQATIYDKDAFRKNGLFDVCYSVVADYEWAVRALVRNHLRFHYFDGLVAVWNRGGVSTRDQMGQIIKAEKKRVIETHYPLAERCYWRLRLRFRKIFGI